MAKKIKYFINLLLPGIGLAMGVAVVVLTTIDADISVNDLFKLLGIACVSFGILALNNMMGKE